MYKVGDVVGIWGYWPGIPACYVGVILEVQQTDYGVRRLDGTIARYLHHEMRRYLVTFGGAVRLCPYPLET